MTERMPQSVDLNLRHLTFASQSPVAARALAVAATPLLQITIWQQPRSAPDNVLENHATARAVDVVLRRINSSTDDFFLQVNF